MREIVLVTNAESQPILGRLPPPSASRFDKNMRDPGACFLLLMCFHDFIISIVHEVTLNMLEDFGCSRHYMLQVQG
jgi:hypothetical protein